MKLETASTKDIEECAEWMARNRAVNDVYPDDLRDSTMLKVERILYVPAKHVLLLESLAPNPKANGRELALALRRLILGIREYYSGEIIYLTRGGTKLDEGAELVGFAESEYKVMRLRSLLPNA